MRDRVRLQPARLQGESRRSRNRAIITEGLLPDETLAECETRILKERYDRDNLELTCDPASNTCQLTCETDVQCPGGFACFDASGDGNSYCVNPTCTLN